jgi:hypothetical protein
MNPQLPVPPPPLPDPPLFEHHLLESPWVIMLLCTIAAGVCWSVSQRLRYPRPLRVAAAVLLMLGFAVVAAAFLVTTDRERVGTRTRELVAAVARADLAAVRAIFRDDARLYFFEQPEGLPLQGILDRLERDFIPGGSYHVTEHSVLDVQVVLDNANRARVQVRVRVTPVATSTPYTSWWRLDYARGVDGEWRVTGIQPLVLPGIHNPRGR